MALRQEYQPANRIYISVEAGVANTGKTVNCTVMRRSDSQWWDGTTGWGGSPTTVGLTEVDATNLPGFYEKVIPVAALDATAGRDGYVARVTEGTITIDELVSIEVTDRAGDVDATWTESLSDHRAVSGSMAAGLFRILGQRQHNTKTVNLTFNSNGLPLTGRIWLYPDKATLVADTGDAGVGSIGQYDYTVTYNGSGQLTVLDSTLEA
jgi:hypothetical protein